MAYKQIRSPKRIPASGLVAELRHPYQHSPATTVPLPGLVELCHYERFGGKGHPRQLRSKLLGTKGDVKMKCVACNNWDWPDNWEELPDWETCPNCDFPVKFTSWVQQLQNEIASLKEENGKLQSKIRLVLLRGKWK